MRALIRIAGILWLALAAAGHVHGQAARTQVRLVLSHDTALPGGEVMAGVHMRMPPGWHTYWRNSGDSGLPVKISWTLPPGIEAGAIQWPVPSIHLANGLTTFVYNEELVLLIPLRLAANLAAAKVLLQAKVTWLECLESCVSGATQVRHDLIIGSAAVPSSDAPLLETWKTKLPRPPPDPAPTAQWLGQPTPTNGILSIQWTPLAGGSQIDFFPYANADYRIAPATERSEAPSQKIELRKSVQWSSAEPPRAVAGLIVTGTGAETQGYEVELPVAAPPAVSGATQFGPSQPSRSLAVILLCAFLGGLILNIMPCVLPVIALKILGFVNQNREDPARVRQLGLVYGLGVIVSFLALAFLVILLKQGGRSASWGMQFQNPQFLVALTVLVLLVALNLFGVFEINLSGRVMGKAGTLAAKEGFSGAFFNGVLATILATPCTAPFLSIALGFAFAQSAPLILLTFLTIGAGLAAPYVLLSWHPAWLKFLPKPGRWMEQFKMAMGFPMLATAVWLFALAVPHFGRGSAFWLGIFLVVIGMAAWVFGQFGQRAGSGKALSYLIVLALIATSYSYILEKKLSWRHPDQKRAGINWAPWSPEAVAKARDEGRPVLVDFTADWCGTCLANKTFALEVPPVEERLRELKAAALIGDYTFEDPRITSELKKYNRPGVPLVLVYPADKNKPPLVLPEVLTSRIVLTALSKARGS